MLHTQSFVCYCCCCCELKIIFKIKSERCRRRTADAEMKNKAAISTAAQHRGDVCYAAAGPRAIACDIKEINGRRARAYKRKKKINFISTAYISKTKRDSLLCVRRATPRACIARTKRK